VIHGVTVLHAHVMTHLAMTHRASAEAGALLSECVRSGESRNSNGGDDTEDFRGSRHDVSYCR
jgi:hypothetical protein